MHVRSEEEDSASDPHPVFLFFVCVQRVRSSLCIARPSHTRIRRQFIDCNLHKSDRDVALLSISPRACEHELDLNPEVISAKLLRSQLVLVISVYISER